MQTVRETSRFRGDVHNLFACQLQGQGADEFVEIIRDVRAEEGHEPRFVAVEVIVAGGNDVADVVTVEAGDNRIEAPGVQEIFDAQRELAAEVTGGGNPDGIVESKG